MQEARYEDTNAQEVSNFMIEGETCLLPHNSASRYAIERPDPSGGTKKLCSEVGLKCLLNFCVFFIVFDDELKVSESFLVEDVWKACGDTWLSAMEAKMEVEIVVCNGMVTCETDVTFFASKRLTIV